MAEQRLNVSTAAQHPKNQHVFIPKAIENKLLANRKTPQAGAQIIVAAASNIWKIREKEESIRNGVNQPIGSFDTATFGSDIVPNAV